MNRTGTFLLGLALGMVTALTLIFMAGDKATATAVLAVASGSVLFCILLMGDLLFPTDSKR